MTTELHQMQEESIRLMKRSVQSMGNANRIIKSMHLPVIEPDITEAQEKSIRLMQENVEDRQDTTEARLKGIRESMTFTRAKKTIKRSGWYFTEPYPPCGEIAGVSGLRGFDRGEILRVIGA